MTIQAQAIAPENDLLSQDTIRQVLADGLAGQYDGAKVLVLIPDLTRTMPMPMLFRLIVEILRDTKQLDFMVALGTHPPLNHLQLNKLVGITSEERDITYQHIGLLNHTWDDPQMLATIGRFSREQIQAFAGDYWHPSLGGDMDIQLNRLALGYDHLLILGPTFPHEVAGFSGGAKYLFPGISGAQIINVTHWLSALVSVLNTIGIKETPTRAIIHAAAEYIQIPITLISVVVVKDGLAGLFVGDHINAWRAAADLSSQRHIRWVDKPYQRVLSWAAPMYEELWTGAKAMYKLEPALAMGSELIIYAPHMAKVSLTHGKTIYEAGYHVRDYFLKQWDQFKHLPTGVLAHCIHARGSGTFEDGIEKPNVQVTLASKISEADCKTLALGYLNPDSINPDEWKDREGEGILFVPKAGEILYRVRE